MKWTVESSAVAGLYDVYDEDGNRVVRHTTHEQAALIASAPDLLAELRLIVEGWDAIESNKIRSLSDWEKERRRTARAALDAAEEAA